MKNYRIIPALIVISLFLNCNNNEASKMDSADSTTATTGRSSEIASSATMHEQRVVMEVVETNGEVVALMNAATTKSNNPALKNISQEMLQGQKNLDSQWRDYAVRKNVSFEDLNAIEIVDIDEDNPTDWDKEWTNEMRYKTRKMIKRLEKDDSKVGETELKEMMNKTLPMLRSNLEKLDQLKKTLKNG
jgi:putative membrane protein